MDLTREIIDALGAPFPDDEIEFLPRGSANGRARALAYIDARAVMRRLDFIVGPENWSFDFDILDSGRPDPKGGKSSILVKGKLTVCGVTKCDAGEAQDEDEALKSAVSDAIKRAAVHFGIGRYLYYLPAVWAPFDGQKRRFTEPPRLAPSAVQHALSICGVGASRSEPAPSRSASPPPAGPRENGEGRAVLAAPQQTQTNAGELRCSGVDCGKALTKGQYDVSLRAYGQPLCPACQKLQVRAA